jgi:hypothetical protein
LIDASQTGVATSWKAITFTSRLHSSVGAESTELGKNFLADTLGARLLGRGEQLITGNSFEGAQKVIDLSGDSASSRESIPIDVVRRSALDQGTTIICLTILCRMFGGRPMSCDLEQAFQNTIIGGDRGFAVTAHEPAQSKLQVRRKLVRITSHDLIQIAKTIALALIVMVTARAILFPSPARSAQQT